ncbi:exosome complex component RRP40 [Nematocida sp. AWRm77]|nr:exosome complex component RRP40 [Nematocida sp. AWRm77]
MFFPGESAKVKGNTSVGIKEGVCTSPGELMCLEEKNYWINFKQVKYVPLLDDLVLGVVKNRGKECFRVDIGAPSYCVINCLDFPNATKRNRVNLNEGDVILGQVVDDTPHSEVQISAKTESVSELGVMKDGILLHIGILPARAFFRSPPSIKTQCTIIFSMNGFAYVSPPKESAIKELLSFL